DRRDARVVRDLLAPAQRAAEGERQGPRLAMGAGRGEHRPGLPGRAALRLRRRVRAAVPAVLVLRSVLPAAGRSRGRILRRLAQLVRLGPRGSGAPCAAAATRATERTGGAMTTRALRHAFAAACALALAGCAAP